MVKKNINTTISRALLLENGLKFLLKVGFRELQLVSSCEWWAVGSYQREASSAWGLSVLIGLYVL